MLADNLEISVTLPSPTMFWRVECAELGAAIRVRRLARRQSIEALAGDAGMHPTLPLRDRARPSQPELGQALRLGGSLRGARLRPRPRGRGLSGRTGGPCPGSRRLPHSPSAAVIGGSLGCET
jgi:hypothetical protein